jgi:hypothetical protein
MLIPERQRPTNERAFRPLRDKTLRAMIRRRFLSEYGYADAVPIAEFITDDLMKLIHQVSQPYERLHPGQMVWLGVPVDLPREYHGRRLGELPLQPIVLSVLTEEDVRELQAARRPAERLALRCKRTARLFQEAYAHGTTLPYADLEDNCPNSCIRVLFVDGPPASIAFALTCPHSPPPRTTFPRFREMPIDFPRFRWYTGPNQKRDCCRAPNSIAVPGHCAPRGPAGPGRVLAFTGGEPMKSRFLHLSLAVLFLLLLAGCGEVPAAPSPGQSPPLPPTLEGYPLLVTRTPLPPQPTPTPLPPPTPWPTLAPSPTPLVVQPTPYAPAEALPAGFPTVAYAVKRGEDPVQLWTLRYERGLLREDLLLNLDPVTIESRTGSARNILGYFWVQGLTFSPDGRYVALVLSNGEAAEPTLVFSVEDGKVFLPLTPGGDAIRLLAWIPGTDRFVGDNVHTWGTVSVDGSSFVHPPIDIGFYRAVVTADGSRILFSGRAALLGSIDVDGGNLTAFPLPDPRPEFMADNLVLSPNGQACAFTWTRGVTFPPRQVIWFAYHGGGQVWTVNTDGSSQRPSGPDDTFDFDLAWSPDGRALAFARQENLGVDVFDPAAELVSSLWIIDVTSGQERSLLPSEGQYAHWSPQWLPDGSGVVFLSNRGGEANAWFVRPDGTGLQQLTRQGGLVGAIAVAPR